MHTYFPSLTVCILFQICVLTYVCSYVRSILCVRSIIIMCVCILCVFMQLLENDIQSHQDHIDDIMKKVRRFRDNNHFQIDNIEDRGRGLVAKYCELEDPMGLRRGQLEDSVQLHQFTHDSNEEMRWVRERETAANSTLPGDSLTSVQGLTKKHQVSLTVHAWTLYRLVCMTHLLCASDCQCAEGINVAC